MSRTSGLAPSRGDRAFVAGLVLLLAIHIAVHVYHIVHGITPSAQVRWTLVVPTWCAFTLVHALYCLGWRRTLWLVGLTFSISFAFEFIGVRTAWPFGAYYYTDVLGPKIAGTVPAVIPFAYLMMLYPSHVVANLMLDGQPVSTQHGWLKMSAAAMLTAFVMSAWDLTTDPVMTTTVGAWVWVDGGPYFGIPFSNFWGWILVIWVVCTVYRGVEARVPIAPLGSPRRWVAFGPIIGYATMAIADTIVGTPEATRLLPTFAMGTPLIAALVRLLETPLDSSHHSTR